MKATLAENQFYNSPFNHRLSILRAQHLLKIAEYVAVPKEFSIVLHVNNSLHTIIGQNSFNPKNKKIITLSNISAVRKLLFTSSNIQDKSILFIF